MNEEEKHVYREEGKLEEGRKHDKPVEVLIVEEEEGDI